MVIGDTTTLLPVTTVCADETGQENRKLPALLASQNDTWVITTGDVNDHDDQVGEFDADFAPPEAADQVTDRRVRDAMVLAVPAAPGSPVCAVTNDPAGAVNAVPASMSSHLFASVVAARPAVTRTPFRTYGTATPQGRAVSPAHRRSHRTPARCRAAPECPRRSQNRLGGTTRRLLQ